VLLLALPALFRPPRGAPLERGLPILGAGCAVYALLLGKWWAWHGAFSAGPRMLSDVLPLLAPGLALFVERAIEARSRLRLGLLGALGALSILSAALLAYVPPKPRTKDLVWELTETGPRRRTRWRDTITKLKFPSRNRDLCRGFELVRCFCFGIVPM
jgi:hypothetical protein